jgi:hypothetical protein
LHTVKNHNAGTITGVGNTDEKKIMIRHVTKILLLLCIPPIFHSPPPAFPAPWEGRLDIGLAAAADDSRIPLVYESVHFWNGILDEIGSTFKLGAVHLQAMPEIDGTLHEMSAQKLESKQTLPYPSFMDDVDTDLLIILTDTDIVSFTEHWEERNKAVIVIKSNATPPLSLPNVVRNVIAHELGHVIGFGHNADETMLMCGRPAVCRPDAFSSTMSHFLPLTEEEKALLRSWYGVRGGKPEIFSRSLSKEKN